MDILSFQTATSLLSAPMAEAPRDAITPALMGLGFHNVHDDDSRQSFLEDAISQKVFGNRPPILAFFLGRQATGSAAFSEMSIGTIDESRYEGPLKMFPIISSDAPAYWEIPVTSFNVNSIPVDIDPSPGETAILDSTGTFNTVDSAVARAIFNEVDGAFAMNYARDVSEAGTGLPTEGAGVEVWALPCTGLPNIGFVLGSGDDATPFAMNALDLNIGQIPAQTTAFVDVAGGHALEDAKKGSAAFCIASIVGLPPAPGTVGPRRASLGTAFMKSFYTVLDASYPPRLGFAKAVLGVADEEAGTSAQPGASQAVPDIGTLNIG